MMVSPLQNGSVPSKLPSKMLAVKGFHWISLNKKSPKALFLKDFRTLLAEIGL
jgi:hypothetical protein